MLQYLCEFDHGQLLVHFFVSYVLSAFPIFMHWQQLNLAHAYKAMKYADPMC